MFGKRPADKSIIGIVAGRPKLFTVDDGAIASDKMDGNPQIVDGWKVFDGIKALDRTADMHRLARAGGHIMDGEVLGLPQRGFAVYCRQRKPVFRPGRGPLIRCLQTGTAQDRHP